MNTLLVTLNLNDNDIRNNGTQNLAEALKMNKVI